jgi:hypothetical protein
MIHANFQPKIGGGGVITVSAGPNQAIYWQLVSLDPDTQEEIPALGSLGWSKTKTDINGLTANLYYAPTDPDLTGRVDRVKVRRVAG